MCDCSPLRGVSVSFAPALTMDEASSLLATCPVTYRPDGDGAGTDFVRARREGRGGLHFFS